MKVMQWCDCQVKCTEDTEGTFTCAAHIADGRAFQCPYTSPEDREKADSRCSDYQKPAMKAILEFDAPKSCAKCPLEDVISTKCIMMGNGTGQYLTDRAPFCPLKIIPERNSDSE